MNSKKLLSLVLCICMMMSLLTGCGLGGQSAELDEPVNVEAESEIESGGKQPEEEILLADEDEINYETNLVSGGGTAASSEKDISGSADLDATKFVTADTSTEAESDKESKTIEIVPAETVVKTEEEVKSEAVKDQILEAIDKNLGNNNEESERQDSSSADPELPFDVENSDAFEEGLVEYADNTILVKLEKGYCQTDLDKLAAAGVGKLDPMFDLEEYSWFTAYLLKGVDVNGAMEQIRQIGTVETAEYNFKYETAVSEAEAAVENEICHNPKHVDQWARHKFGIKEAWGKHWEKHGTGGGKSTVTVAVIDTGVDYNHVDLKANMWKNTGEIDGNGIDDDGNGYVDDYYGVDMTARKGSGMDDNGHGTHVAGIIGAVNNKEGVVGLAYNTKIMAIKAGDASGYFLQDNIAKSIIYAYDHGADVINMSFGGSASSIAVQDALAVAYSRCVLVAAAGNDGKPNQVADYYPIPSPNYPAALSYVLGVMSVGENMVESAFSNWDCYLYNSVEYEVYAPGEQMISTLPGDKYGKLSGTSMAAPVVAAQAAMLRSYFEDTDTYPTKFIYGQIVGTADDIVHCANLAKHTVNDVPHNIPGVINFAASMEELPIPDIGVSDYTVFDTAGFEADNAGVAAEAAEVNNGDGIVDAGEILALGMTLKNRWGMSENTKVHIDAVSPGGVEHPYVTILNNDIDYGSVGTYSENDSGKIMGGADGKLWTGWENPFYITIADDCPNEYTVTLNITVTYENALNLADDTVYETKDQILLVVRRGTVLPNLIKEDTTLTKDHYYIIENTTTVVEGATLTVEEGTQIQFWCSDPSDAYADLGIAFLEVKGNLICKGTEEEPIEIFPSEWMGDHRVEITSKENGYVSMEWTNITNGYITAQEAANCVFNQNYEGGVDYRYLSGSSVYRSTSSTYFDIDEVTDCAFYKLGGRYYPARVWGGHYERCIFVDSAINYDSMGSAEDCIFYGNHTNTEGSDWSVHQGCHELTVKELIYNAYTGKTYIVMTGFETERIAKRFFKLLGGDMAMLDSSEEIGLWMQNLPAGNEVYYCGLYTEDGAIFNHDGSEALYDYPGITVSQYGRLEYKATSNQTIYLSSDVKTSGMSVGKYTNFIVEIPGEIYIAEVHLEEYLIDLDLNSSYQIKAEVRPDSADTATLVYESQDESVVTVDKNGMLRPVGPGTTTVRVYAPDYAVYNYITVNVKDLVPLEALAVSGGDFTMDVNTSKQLGIVYTPADTTRKAVTYVSSNPEVADVDTYGLVTAKYTGSTVITVTGDNGVSTTVNVEVVVPAVTMAFAEDTYVTSLTSDDGTAFYPVITPADTTNQTLIWETSNPEVCYVDENGKLVKLKEGTAVLKATLVGTDIAATMTVAVTEAPVGTTVVKMMYAGEINKRHLYALLNDGTLWLWGYDLRYPQQININDVKDFVVEANTLYILNSQGILEEYRISNSDFKYSITKNSEFKPLSNIVALSSEEIKTNASYFAITEDGAVWAWGNNYSGQLGVGTTETSVDAPTLVDIKESIAKIVNTYYGTVFLTTEGRVYGCGSTENRYNLPVLLYENVIDISRPFNANNQLLIEQHDKVISWDSALWKEGNIYIKDTSIEKHTYYYEYYIEEGYLFVQRKYTEDDFTKIESVPNVKKVYAIEETLFVQTEDEKLYGLGNGSNYMLGNGSNETITYMNPVRIYFGLTDNEDAVAFESSNLDVNEEDVTVLTEGAIVLEYNQSLVRGDTYSSIAISDSTGTAVTFTKELDLDKLTITPRTEFTDGETYTLIIPAGALTDRAGTLNEELVLTFTYVKRESEEEVVPDEPVINDTVIDEDKLGERHFWTVDEVMKLWSKFVEDGLNTRFYSNVILNRLNDDNTSNWLRFTAGDGDYNNVISLGGNYWGTSDVTLINKQILDYDDYNNLADVNIGEILTKAPDDTFPFVVNAWLEVDEELVDTVGNDLVTFNVEFNRDMDTTIPLAVRFGSAYPYADYTVEGGYVTPTHWQGTMQLTTIIENGYQYWSVSDGMAAETSLKLYTDWGRFPFKIDTTAAKALIMQAETSEDGIQLTWTQDDFDTLAGYNVYRSTAEDGQYTKLNRTVIPADTKEWFDDGVIPGETYYYNFTVVQTDFTESEPSGKVVVTAMDTMAPNIYHSPVYHAFTGSNLVISATVTDNVIINSATLYYRSVGSDEWQSKVMNSNNDKYSAIIPAEFITLEGVEYYIEATDGISVTAKGSADAPYMVTVQLAVADSDKGDVDGSGKIELRDALMLLMAINDRLNLTEDQFARADLDGSGELAAKEALRIIQYVNGSVGSILF